MSEIVTLIRNKIKNLRKKYHPRDTADAMYHIVTGGNRGIGVELVKLLAADHRNVILTARDLQKGAN